MVRTASKPGHLPNFEVTTMRWFILLLTVVFMQSQLMALVSDAQEISFWEEFALSDDRIRTLEKLVPRSEEYYFFHCLHAQNEDRLDAVDTLLKQWIKEHSRTEQVRIIENRQALLKYGEDPGRTLDYLIRQLGVSFNHQRKIPQAQKDLPTKLAASKIDPGKLVSKFLNQDSNSLGNFDDKGLYYLANKPLNTRQRRELLKRLKDPTFPGVVGMIARDLKGKDAKRFGSIEIHRRLTRAQLTELSSLAPELNSQKEFINEMLLRMQPSADVDIRSNAAAYRTHLDEMWAYVQNLSPSFNSLKVSVLYRLLELDQREDRMDRKRFISYLELPRRANYINPQLTDGVRSSRVAHLSDDYSTVTRCLPVGNDERLVQDYLHHFLQSAPNANAFANWFESDYLKHQFATAKILSGSGDRDTWASMLDPPQYQSLLERIDLDFAASNREHFDVGDIVELKVFTKNIDKLIVKVFEINTRNFYRRYQREVDTDISLDGLVANDEQLYEYDDAPLLRKSRSFKFDKLNKRGVYIIDFIGGGKSSRALIRKGKLQLVGKVTPVGQQFNVVNESGILVSDAQLLVGGRKYVADDDGNIDVPFSAQSGMQNAIVSQGNFSSLQVFTPVNESYALRSAFHIDRESLTQNNQATVAIRPSLSVGKQPISLARLDSCKLEITTTSIDGVSATKTYDNLDVSETQETIVKFRVPPRLKTVSLHLEAKLTNELKQKIELSAADSFNVNLIDATSEIQDIHLLPANTGWYAEVLGKTGERRKGQPVRFRFHIGGLKQHVDVDLQTDGKGQIELGSLDHVQWVEATVSGGTTRRWNPNPTRMHLSANYHLLKGEELSIPLPDGDMKLDRSLVSLLETRSSRYVRDCYASLEIDDHRLRISDLSPGDYLLHIRSSLLDTSSQKINIRVTAGKAAGNVLVGNHRILQQNNPSQPFAKAAAVDDGRLSIKIEDFTESTRVHVYPIRYLDAFDPFADFRSIRSPEPWTLDPAIRKSAYMAGRKIGEEYQYILNRRYAPRFPGNMLERPSLLLNPWAVQDTQNEDQMAAAGEAPSESGVERQQAAQRERPKKGKTSQKTSFANLDFLGAGQVDILNLRPNRDGLVELTAEQIGNAQAIRVVVVDLFSVSQSRILRQPQNFKTQDQRLANALDPEKHYRQARQIELLDKGDSLVIRDVLSAQFQQYDELSDVYGLFRGLGNDGNKLRRFQFIMNWLDYAEEEKRRLYSEHACHELNFFIFKKDKSFFESVVRKHLQNKREKTFLDQWLLGEDVSSWLAPWRFAKLNIVEKILLSQRYDDRREDIARHIRELYELSPTPRSQYDDLYRYSLAANELDGDSRELREKLKSLKSMQNNIEGDLNDYAREVEEFSLGDSFATPAPQARAGDSPKLTAPDGGTALFGGVVRGGRALKLDRKENLGYEAKFAAPIRLETRSRIVNGVERLYEMEVQDSESLAPVAGKATSPSKLYRRIEPTREWVENNYYQQLPATQNANLVTVNQFWADYASHDAGTFASEWFAEANRSFTEMMFALSVLDLPLSDNEENVEIADQSLTIKANGPMIVLHQQNEVSEFDRRGTTVLVSENFFQSSDRYRYEDGIRFDKFVERNFLANVLYGAEVVITNPTSTPMAIEVLVQIPSGAMPANGSWPTRTISMQLNAFSTQKLEYSFYFPAAGDFTHYPAHVSSEAKILSVAETAEFNVIDQLPEIDKESWAWVSQNGTKDDVIDFLLSENIQRANPSEIAFRMKDRDFFKRTTDIMRNRCRYDHTLWSYSLKHNDSDTLREYVEHADAITSRCGLKFQSEILNIDPLIRNWFEQREFSPLVNSRAHQLGGDRKILNARVHQQYEKLMKILGHQATLDSDNRLVVTYYLLLQDRIDEAIAQFEQIDADSIAAAMPYAYCDAYLDLYREKPDDALAKAQAWADYPVDRWRKKFESIVSMVNEINGQSYEIVDLKDREQQQDKLASEAPGFEFEIVSSGDKRERGKGVIDWRNVGGLTINYYQMDIEFLFSSNPFARDQVGGFSMIRPNHSESVTLDGAKSDGRHEFVIPEKFDNQNVLVEIVAGESTKSKTWYSNSMDVQVVEQYGQILLTDRATDKPISKAYVKVFTKSGSGKVTFHKDGYTDLRGRFDFVTQSNRSLNGISDYAILVISDEKGAVIKEAKPPRE